MGPRRRHARPTSRSLSLVLLLGLVAAACGPAPDDSTGADAPDEAVPTTRASTPPSTTEPPPTERPSTDDAATDLGRLVRCHEVPELTTTVEGSLGQFSNPDDEVMGVLVTYRLEHPDTFAGLWIDRDRGGTLVLAFTDDPKPHLEAILARGPSPDDEPVASPRPPIRDPRPLGERHDVSVDVVRALFSDAELMAANDDFWRDRPPYVLSGSIDTTRNRVSIDLIDPTPDQLADLAGRVQLDRTCVTITVTPTPPAGPLDVLPRAGTDLSCGGGGHHAFPASALDERVPVGSLTHPAAQALLETLADPPPRAAQEDIEQPPPADGWFLLAIQDDTAVFGRGEEIPIMAAFLDRAGNAWRFSGWTIGCAPTVTLPEGLHGVRVALDPHHPRPGPDDMSIHLLVTERACASGQAMGDRLRGPQIRETDDEILIAFAVETRFEPATCPSNPSEAVTIELEHSVGSRPIRNGLTYPPSEIDFPLDR